MDSEYQIGKPPLTADWYVDDHSTGFLITPTGNIRAVMKDHHEIMEYIRSQEDGAEVLLTNSEMETLCAWARTIFRSERSEMQIKPPTDLLAWGHLIKTR